MDSPDPKMCKSTKNRKSKICTITKVPLYMVWWGTNKELRGFEIKKDFHLKNYCHTLFPRNYITSDKLFSYAKFDGLKRLFNLFIINQIKFSIRFFSHLFSRWKPFLTVTVPFPRNGLRIFRRRFRSLLVHKSRLQLLFMLFFSLIS